MAATSDTRPPNAAGPTGRQRKPAMVAESRFCAPEGTAAATRTTKKKIEARRKRCMAIPLGGTGWRGAAERHHALHDRRRCYRQYFYDIGLASVVAGMKSGAV